MVHDLRLRKQVGCRRFFTNWVRVWHRLTGPDFCKCLLFQALPYECYIFSPLQSLLCFSLSFLYGTYSCNKPIWNIRVDCKKAMGKQWHFLRHYWGQRSMSLPFYVTLIAYSTSVMNFVSSVQQEAEHKTMHILESCTSLIVNWKCFAVLMASQ